MTDTPATPPADPAPQTANPSAAPPAAAKEKTVSVACSLPSGLTIEVKGKTYTLKGPNPLKPSQKFGHTHVPADAWDAWIATHEDFAPVVSGAIVGRKPSDKAKADAEMAKQAPASSPKAA